MSLTISIVALGIACIALVAALTSGAKRQHFTASSQCSRVIGEDGQEHDLWSFSSSHSNSLIGRTFGKLCIAVARRRHERLVQRSAAAKQKA